jgi:hypothetical protein
VLSWKTPKDKPFPMPVEVKVGGKIVTLPMADGTGRVTVGDTVPVIVDPASKVLRRQPYVEAVPGLEEGQGRRGQGRSRGQEEDGRGGEEASQPP